MNPSTALGVLEAYSTRTRDIFELCLIDGAKDSIRSGTSLSDSKITGVLARAQLRIGCGWEDLRNTISTTTIVSKAPVHPIEATSPSGTATKQETPTSLTVYCDGSCLNNGRRGASAGYAVVAMRGGAVIHRFSEKVPATDPQTNQRAELLALRYAIHYLAESGSSGDIHTDSRYSIDCITKWATGWKKAGWKKADKQPVLHLDIIRPLYELWTGLSLLPLLPSQSGLSPQHSIRIHHVAAHTGRSDAHSVGNALVDEMARGAATSP